MASLADDLQPRATVRFEHRFLILDYRFAIPAIDKFSCRRESCFKDCRQNVIRKMVHKLANRIKGLAAVWATGAYHVVLLNNECVQVMFAEF